jgi:hypothetical protein
VRRVNPSANVTTRQVEVLVDFAGQKAPRLAGLYAEGRVETESAASLTIPATALVREGDKASAWVVKDGKLAKVPLTLGERDPRTGDWAVAAGLAEGSQVIRHPNTALKDGQLVQASPGKSSETKTANAKTAEAPKN